MPDAPVRSSRYASASTRASVTPPDGKDESLRFLAALLAAGYLRLLGLRAISDPPVPATKESEKLVDSRCPKSVNWVEHEGGRDA
jgi:hypothetical protein